MMTFTFVLMVHELAKYSQEISNANIRGNTECKYNFMIIIHSRTFSHLFEKPEKLRALCNYIFYV